MDLSFILLLLLLIFLLGGSVFFSASETAFSTANIIRLKKYKEQGKKGANEAFKIATHYEKTLSVILVGNNLANILLTAISTAVFTNLYGVNGVIISTIVMTITILFFGEFLPKKLARKNPSKLALKFSRPLRYVSIILAPITNLILFFSKGVSKVYTIEDDDDPSVTEDELISIVETIEEEGVLGEAESDLIKSAIEFDDDTINNIYTKKEDIVMIDIKTDNKEVLKVMLNNHYSRVPIYENNEENIIGVLSEKDYLSEYIRNKDVNVKKIMRKPIVVRNNMRIANLLSLMQEKKEHLAIVKDTNNRLLGIITLEDSIEYLVGEIYDEHDDVPDEALS
jgi:CBS domain containing-hemolysin-like protein